MKINFSKCAKVAGRMQVLSLIFALAPKDGCVIGEYRPEHRDNQVQQNAPAPAQPDAGETEQSPDSQGQGADGMGQSPDSQNQGAGGNMPSGSSSGGNSQSNTSSGGASSQGSGGSEKDQDAGSPPEQKEDAGPVGPEEYLKKKPVFSLPKSWEFSPDDSTKARLQQPTKDGAKPYVVIHVDKAGIGTQNEAKDAALKDYHVHFDPCAKAKPDDPGCNPAPQYQEKQLAGEQVYIVLTTGTYWGKSSWYSSVYLSKGGYLYQIDLDDQAGNQENALKTVISTLVLK